MKGIETLFVGRSLRGSLGTIERNADGLIITANLAPPAILVLELR